MRITMKIEVIHPLCWAWGCLARTTMHAKAHCCLFKVFGSLRDLGEIWSTNWSRLLLLRSHWKMPAQMSKLGGVRLRKLPVGLRNHWFRANGVSQADGDLRFDTCLCQTTFNKGTIAPATASVPGKICPDPTTSPTLTLVLVNLISPHMSLAAVP